MAAKKQNEQKVVYYVVNPAGAIHNVEREHANQRLRQPGWRMATEAEVKALQDAGGNQTFDAPICKSWSPEIEAGPELAE